jgi:hypothetical protein
MVPWIDAKVTQHLDCFCILNSDVISLHHGLIEELMHELPKFSPGSTIGECKYMIATGD